MLLPASNGPPGPRGKSTPGRADPKSVVSVELIAQQPLSCQQLPPSPISAVVQPPAALSIPLPLPGLDVDVLGLHLGQPQRHSEPLRQDEPGDGRGMGAERCLPLVGP